MNAAMASTTRITVAETPCPGALASRSDAAQGFSSGGLHLMYMYCDFAAHRVSHSAKRGESIFGPIFETVLLARKRNRARKSVTFF